MSIMTPLNTAIISSLALLLLSACSSEEKVVKENETVLDHKIDAVNEAKKSVATINTKTQPATAVPDTQAPPVNASALYTNKCASCHGTNAQKSALNASENIALWDAKKIEDALHGYKNGSYGGKMKAIMQAQSKPLNDEEIRLLSNYITRL